VIADCAQKNVPLVVLVLRHHHTIGVRCLISCAIESLKCYSKDRLDLLLQFIRKWVIYSYFDNQAQGGILYIEDDPSVAPLTIAILEKSNMFINRY